MADNTKNSSIFVNNLKIAFGSALANFAADTLCYPMDTINTWIKTSSRHDNTMAICREHIKKDGVSVLFKGVNTQFYVAFIPGFIYYFFYEMTNRVGRNCLEYFNKSHFTPFIPTISAGISEMASLLILVPMDALKTRMQLNIPEYNYPSLMHGIRDIIKKEGYLRLFQASPLYIFHALIFNMILFQVYELSRINMMKRENKKNNELTLLNSLENTLIATVIATMITNPLDLVITRYQCIDSSQVKLSAFDVVRDVYKRDGIRGINRGVYFRTLYQCMESCIYLPVYEELRKRYGYDFADQA